ncbi:MAG TPA: hypothetical protein VNJ52_03575 [Patescibacteria group bacterium]|nr:hypothetical protein [Patescibacteria group bacterium]
MRLGPAKPFIAFMRRMACSAVLLLAVPVSGAAQAIEAPATTETVFRWLNFVLVFGLGGWWISRKLKSVFERQAEQIAAAIATAEAARQASQDRLRAAEGKLAALDSEIVELRGRARLDSAAEAKRIQGLAREEAARIERAAEAELAAAELAAANRLREMAIDKTIEYARARATEKLTLEVDARLVGRFVDALVRAGGPQ